MAGFQVAQDTFVAELKSGPLAVVKGQVFPGEHEVVKLDKGRGLLFQPLDEPEAPAPESPRPRTRAPKAV